MGSQLPPPAHLLFPTGSSSQATLFATAMHQKTCLPVESEVNHRRIFSVDLLADLRDVLPTRILRKAISRSNRWWRRRLWDVHRIDALALRAQHSRRESAAGVHDLSHRGIFLSANVPSRNQKSSLSTAAAGTTAWHGFGAGLGSLRVWQKSRANFGTCGKHAG